MTATGTTMTYDTLVVSPVEVESAPYYSLEELVPFPCEQFLQRGFVPDLNTALTTAVNAMTDFTDCTLEHCEILLRFYIFHVYILCVSVASRTI